MQECLNRAGKEEEERRKKRMAIDVFVESEQSFFSFPLAARSHKPSKRTKPSLSFFLFSFPFCSSSQHSALSAESAPAAV